MMTSRAVGRRPYYIGNNMFVTLSSDLGAWNGPIDGQTWFHVGRRNGRNEPTCRSVRSKFARDFIPRGPEGFRRPEGPPSYLLIIPFPLDRIALLADADARHKRFSLENVSPGAVGMFKRNRYYVLHALDRPMASYTYQRRIRGVVHPPSREFVFSNESQCCKILD